MTVFLVGAGPGDPGLITVRGAELLARADVVVFDRLASPAAARPRAGRRRAHRRRARRPGASRWTRTASTPCSSTVARAASTVVRLKGGDPFVFGRGGEEAEALRDAGIDFEVVPGITSAISAPAYAGIPVTHRGLSTHVTVVTGHEDPAKGRTDVDWEALARAGGTLVILMGAGRIARHRPAPARRRPRRRHSGRGGPQRHPTRPATVRTTLGALAASEVDDRSAVGDRRRRGRGARPRAGSSDRPLFGRRDRGDTRARAGERAARPGSRRSAPRWSSCPSIAITPLEFDGPRPRRVRVARVHVRERRRPLLRRGPRRARASTRARARRPARSPRSDRAPRPRSLTRRARRPGPRALRRRVAARRVPAPGARRASGCCSPGPSRPATSCPRVSRAAGYVVDVLAVYRTEVARPEPDGARAGASRRRRRGHLHVVVDGHELLRPRRAGSPNPRPPVVSIGPVTSATAAARGLAVTAEADPHTIDALVDALLSHARPPDRSVPSTGRSGPKRRYPTLRRSGRTHRGESRSSRAADGGAGSLVSCRSPSPARVACAAPRRCAASSRRRRVRVDDLVAPLFVKEGIAEPEPVASMPGVVQHTLESLRKEVRALADLGVPAVILFGDPGVEGRRRLRRRRPRRHRAGGAADPARRGRRRSRAHGRRLPRRVHRPRPLRRAHRRRARSTTTRRSSATRASRSRRPTPAPT